MNSRTKTCGRYKWQSQWVHSSHFRCHEYLPWNLHDFDPGMFAPLMRVQPNTKINRPRHCISYSSINHTHRHTHIFIIQDGPMVKPDEREWALSDLWSKCVRWYSALQSSTWACTSACSCRELSPISYTTVYDVIFFLLTLRIRVQCTG